MQAIKWQNVTIGYGKKQIFKDLSLEIPRGSFVLIQGDNGSGKTTLMKTIEERHLLKQGRIEIHPELLKNASYIAQNSAIKTYFPLSIHNTIAMGLYSITGYLRSLFGVNHNLVYKILKELGLDHKKHHLLRECSGGELKKTLLGRALIKEPALLIMDEPFVNIDAGSCQVIINSIKHHNQKRQMTVVLISHHYELVKDYVQKILTVKDGRIYEQ